MTDLRQAAMLALEALIYCEALNRDVEQQKTQAITALRTALEQSQQEPVGMVKELFTNAAWNRLDVPGSTKVYLVTPPAAQRKWIGLTDDEFLEACQLAERGNYLVAFQRIQAKLKERNT